MSAYFFTETAQPLRMQYASGRTLAERTCRNFAERKREAEDIRNGVFSFSFGPADCIFVFIALYLHVSL